MDRNPRRLRALKLGYRVLPSASPSRHEPGVWPVRPPVAPLGFAPFRVFTRSSWRAFRPASSHALVHRLGCPWRQHLHRRVSIDERVSPTIAGRTSLLGFLRLNVPGTRPCCEPGLCVHLASRRTLPCNRRSLFGFAPADRSCQGR